MNWFQRHLNLTALGMAILSAGVLIFLVKFSLGFGSLYWRNTLDLGFPIILLLSLSTITWLALSAIGYGWILYRKNHSPFFLVVFLPALVTIIGCLIYHYFFTGIDFGHDIIYGAAYEAKAPSNFPIQITFINIIILIVAWLLLLILNNRSNSSVKTDDNQNVSFKDKRPHPLYGLYGFSSRIKYTAISTSVFAVIISLISCLLFSYGYITYHLPGSLFSEFPEISFEYPANHYQPVYHQFKLIFDGNYRIVKEISFYQALEHSTASLLYITSYNITIEESWGGLDVMKEHILESFETPRDEFQYVYSPVMVGDISAYQLIVCFGVRMLSNDSGTQIHVYFDHDGYSWFIDWYSHNVETLQPPAFFTHLLETFKIYN